MADNLHGDDAVVTEQTCGICLQEPKDPLDLPCGHSFCDGCLNEWRSRYGVEAGMRRKCPICRARIPPSKEMVATMLAYRDRRQSLENKNDTSSEDYHHVCTLLGQSEELVGADWDGVTVLEHSNDEETPVVMPRYIAREIVMGDIKSVLKWINANRTEDRVNAVTSAETLGMSALMVAAVYNNLALMSLLLQLGSDVDTRSSQGISGFPTLKRSPSAPSRGSSSF